MSFAIPIRRLRETSTLISFPHPQPSYPVHILLVPKKALSGLEALSPEDDSFYSDLFSTVQSLVAEMRLAKQGYRLMVNGGCYQDVPQLHFHLVSSSTGAGDEITG